MWSKKVKTSICIAHNVYTYTSNALSSLNWAARPLRPPPTACTHKLHAVARSPATDSQQQSGLHLRNPSLMGYYSFNRPRRDGRLSWPCWSTDSGRFTHKVVTRPAISLAQDRESSPARTGGLTTKNSVLKINVNNRRIMRTSTNAQQKGSCCEVNYAKLTYL